MKNTGHIILFATLLISAASSAAIRQTVVENGGPASGIDSTLTVASDSVSGSAVLDSTVKSKKARPKKPKYKHVYGKQTVEKTLPPPPDSVELARLDSIRVADSLFSLDSAALMKGSSLEAPAFSSARDSIIEVFTDGQRKIFYYGDVSVEYQGLKLTAERMEYDMNLSEVFAYGVYDSIQQAWIGKPVMTQGGKTYNMDEVRYNFTSHRSRIKNVVTEEDQALIHGERIKMMEDNRINMTGGKYTVCDCEHPHYYLQLSSATILTKPSQKTVFGPSHVVVEDVHIPLGLPFGFVPKRPDRATGLLMPTFGEESTRGFYVKDMGMYFVFGDYFDFSLTGDYFTLGSWAVDFNARYKVNYKFNGTFALNYSYDQTGERGSADFNASTNFGVKWSHQQDSKAHPGTSFSASVNFSSPSNSRYNSRSVSEALNNQVSSSISYSKNWNGKINLSVNALHSQNSRDSSYSLSIPNIAFSVSTFYPFKRKNAVGKERAYEKISFGYSTSLSNSLNFKASECGTAGFYDKMQTNMSHNFSIGLPSFNLLNYINFSPSISYSQNWYFRNYDAKYNAETDRVETTQSGIFSSFGIMQRASAGLSVSTRIYGTFNFGTYHKIQAIRHVFTPSLNISYTPPEGLPMNGYTTYKYTDSKGQEQSYQYNRYTGSQGSGSGQAASMSFSFGNNLEAKVRDYKDTTGTGSKKVKIIDQFNITGSYNFLADSMKLSNIGMNVSTNLLNKINLSGSCSFSPYAINERGVTIGKYAVTQGQGLLRLTTASISASYAISGKGEINGNEGNIAKDGSKVEGAADYYRRIYYHPITNEYIPGGWLYYTNPKVPWSVNLSGQLSYNKSYKYDQQLSQLETVNNFTATLSFSGSIKLSPKMNINFTSGYDFISKGLSTTQISATYDLHCFNISVSWVPTGLYKQYSFRIAANASALADLLQFKKSSSMWDQ